MCAANKSRGSSTGARPASSTSTQAATAGAPCHAPGARPDPSESALRAVLGMSVHLHWVAI
ncbi:hypothetical protein CDL15_Pgr007822 [Punica granatum]|uniref:Uncharacterized protein n=1 Tax=Punica granatum TaxID=22663 RepID=A0A218XA32_PUNGR|nr:hypothetical protein CDL15_Pgr007822 [Punica granatum]